VLITLASAALEISLDRGQIDDWFGSRLITIMILIAIFGWIGTVAWELYIKDPIIDFRFLNNRNFAIASCLFFTFGVGLFGTTTLIPQVLQSIYGYWAIDAGLVLYPGALVITYLAPISAQLLQRNIVSAKTVVRLSLATGATAMFLFSTVTLDTDGSHFRWIRSMQGFGYGLFLVPVNLIAFVTTAAERRAELHQLNLGSNIGSSSPALHESTAGLVQQFMQHGLGPVLPILTYNDMDAAIREVKKRPKPLSGFLFSRDQKTIDHFLASLSFGGTINQVNIHLFIETMPFGGVGHSSIGHYYGKASCPIRPTNRPCASSLWPGLTTPASASRYDACSPITAPATGTGSSESCSTQSM